MKNIKYMCGNLLCNAVDDAESTMLACAGCKCVRYCSKSCQRWHWKDHKIICQDNQQRIAEIAKAQMDGLSLMERKLRHWTRFYALDLLAATVHALDIPSDLTRVNTHVLCIHVRLRDDTARGTPVRDMCASLVNMDRTLLRPEALFEIKSAVVMEQSSARLLGENWRIGLGKLDVLRKQSYAAGRGPIAAVVIKCEPFNLYFIPFGSFKDLERLQQTTVLHGSWEEILKARVCSGKKFTAFDI